MAAIPSRPPGARLASWAKVHGVTQTALSHRLEISQAHVGRLFRCEHVLIDPALAVKIEGITGIPARLWYEVAVAQARRASRTTRKRAAAAA